MAPTVGPAEAGVMSRKSLKRASQVLQDPGRLEIMRVSKPVPDPFSHGGVIEPLNHWMCTEYSYSYGDKERESLDRVGSTAAPS